MAKGTRQFQVHDESVNSYEIIVLTAGLDTSVFKKNPVMLFMHDPALLIGRWEDLEVEGAEVKATPHFNSKNEFAAAREQEANDGFLNGASLGLIPREFADGMTMGLGDVLVITKSTLTEISLCSIPSNHNAIQLYNADGEAYTEDEMKELKLSICKQKSKPDMKPEQLKKLALSLGLPESATLDQCNTKIADLKAAADKVELSEKAAKEAKEALQKEHTAKIELMVQNAVDDKKIKPELKETYIKLATANYDETKEVLDQMTAAVKPLDLVNTKGGEAGAGGAGEKDFDWYSEHAPKELNLMRINKPEEFDALREAASKKVRDAGLVSQ